MIFLTENIDNALEIEFVYGDYYTTERDDLTGKLVLVRDVRL